MNADRLRTLLDGLPDLAWEADASGLCTWVNRQWIAYSGRTPEQLGGAGWLEAFQVEDRAALAATWQQIRAEGRAFEGEARILRHDGVARWFRLRGIPLRDASGRITGWVGWSVDVHELHEARLALEESEAVRQRSEAIFSAFADTVDDLLWLFDARKQQLLLLGSPGRQFAGWPIAELDSAYRTWFETVEPEDQSIAAQAVLDALEQGYSTCEYRIRGPDGAIHWIRNRAARANTPEGPLVAAISTDITRERVATRELYRREALFRGLVESLPHVVWAAAPDGRITYLSPSAEAFLADAETRNGIEIIDSFVHPEHREDSGRSFFEAMSAGHPLELVQRVRQADGSWRWTRTHGVAVRGADGSIESWIGATIDIQDLKEATERLEQRERELEQADRRKDEFIAMLGHELRTPLAPIRNAASLLEAHARRNSDPQVGRAVGVILRQADHLARLVDDLLDVSRITHGIIELERAPVDLEEVLLEAIEVSRGAIEQRDQVVSLETPDATVTVSADRTRLVQVLCNLLSNASRFTPDRGRIRVVASDDGQEAVVRVIDDGIGISPELQSRIFDLFARGQAPDSRAAGGLGIGLGLVRQLVELHGGSVSVASGGPGTGSEFTIRVPLLRAAGTPEVDRPPTEVRRAQSLQVVVVEDNADAAWALRMLLELDGHDVRGAGDGPSGLRAISELRPDAAFVDIGLPGFDGLEVARRVRAEPDLARLYLVAVSAYGRGEDREAALAAGFDAFLTKPTSHATISAILARLAPARKDRPALRSAG